MFSERFKGIRIVVSDAAMRELMKGGLTITDVIEVLEAGYPSPRKRREGTIEMWLDKGSKTRNAVIVKDFNEVMREQVWVLVHFGKFTRRKNRKKGET